MSSLFGYCHNVKTIVEFDALGLATHQAEVEHHWHIDNQRLAAEAAAAAEEQTSYAAEPVASPMGAAVNYGISGNAAKDFIYQHESGNNPNAVNPSSGACGLCQALPCSKMGCPLGDYACQDAWCTSYMAGRYGTWEAAYNFWISNRWW